MPKCFHCKSSNIKKLSAIISQGTKEIDLGHGFLGIGGSNKNIGIGLAKGKSKGTIKDSLVTRMEKQIPRQTSIFKVMVYAFFGFALIFGGIADPTHSSRNILMLIGIGLFYLAYSARKKRKNYSSELIEFKKKWYCYSCDKFSIDKK
jgi:hypothetical protein